MRKRRVGVTARSRRIVGKQATDSPQIASEMAAPLCIENTNGHRGEGRKQSADGSMATMAHLSQTAEGNRKESKEQQARELGAWEVRALRAHEALPQTPPGGKNPLRPPAPFPCCLIMPNGGNQSRVRKPRKKRAPLTDSLRSEAPTEIRERGPSGWRRAAPPVGRQRGTRADRGNKKQNIA